MLEIRWSSLSLRQSLLISMALTLLPLFLAAACGYFVLHRTVVADYQDVARRQRELLQPINDLQLLMLQVEIPLEEYLVAGSETRMAGFRAMRQQVEATWPRIQPQLDGELAGLAARAREDWNSLDKVVADLVAARAGGHAAALQEAQSRFDSLQAAAHDKLEALGLLVEQDIERDYRDAALGLERSEWIAGTAAALSLLFMAGGITLFYRTILNSINRLIEGAERFSEGDREHRIEVQIPKELHLVAEELNKMIGTIRESEDRLIEMAHRDRLTGLLNRATWEDVVAEALQRMQRLHEGFALVTADIDHFKKINDSHGHDMGDEVLRRVAGVITEAVRTIDKVFRLGGEEFCMLLPATDAAGARITAERIRQAVADMEIRAGGQGLRVTISLGIAVASATANTTTMLSKQADIALYRAKVSGRNAVVLYEDGL